MAETSGVRAARRVAASSRARVAVSGQNAARVAGTGQDAATRPQVRELYLQTQPDPVLVHVHTPPAAGRPRVGVLICPPFGWEELCSYRSRRWLAESLAAAGHVAVRIDLPGSGDSAAGPNDPGRLPAWNGAITGAVDWLRTELACTRVVAFGIGLGGLLACHALTDRARIDDLVLWGAPARGRLLVRELRAFAHVSAAESDHPADRDAEEDGLEVAGFTLSDETAAALEGIDLTTRPLPPGAGRRVLLIGRDEAPPDRRLHAHLCDSGAAVTVLSGPGYAEMMTHPQFAITPREVLREVVEWVGAEARPTSARLGEHTAPVAAGEHLELSVAGTAIRERPLQFEHRGRILAGVLTEPLGETRAPFCALLLSAGSIRRVGPNRMWVETARRWAADGVVTLRFDVEGVGDSDGDEERYLRTSEFYRPELTEQARSAFDALAAEGLPERFIVGGLCSGAYWSFQAALADERVEGLVLVNLWHFFYSDDAATARDLRQAWRLLRQGRLREIIRIANEDGRIVRLLRTLLHKLAHPGIRVRRGRDDVDRALDALRDRDVRTLLLLGDGEALEDFLVRTGRMDQMSRWPNIRIERIPLEDHTFRPRWAQRQVRQALDLTLQDTIKPS